MQLKLLIFTIHIISCCALKSNSSDADIDCSNHNVTANKTCCKVPIFYSDELQNESNYKLNEDVKTLTKMYGKKQGEETAICLSHKYLKETVGFVVHEEFLLEKFNVHIKNITGFTGVEHEVMKIAERCINITVDFKIKEIQEEKVGIKLEDCNFEFKFMYLCIANHLTAVRLTKKI